MEKFNKLYDILKYFYFFGLPAIGYVFGELVDIWNIPNGVAIARTITVVTTGLGIALGIANIAYNKKKQIGEN